MARIVECRVCGSEVSRDARGCPRCGMPPPRSAWSTVAVVLAVAAIGTVFGLAIRQKREEQRAAPDATVQQPRPAERPPNDVGEPVTAKGLPLEACENLAFAWFAKEGDGFMNSMRLDEGARRCLGTYDAPARARYCSRIASGHLMYEQRAREEGDVFRDAHAIRYVQAAMSSACGR
jgi:RNA polymerase subunit RPABC4/transcription elongation factor Spt4